MLWGLAEMQLQQGLLFARIRTLRTGGTDDVTGGMQAISRLTLHKSGRCHALMGDDLTLHAKLAAGKERIVLPGINQQINTAQIWVLPGINQNQECFLTMIYQLQCLCSVVCTMLNKHHCTNTRCVPDTAFLVGHEQATQSDMTQIPHQDNLGVMLNQ
eukprot:GHUV01020695.1.p1 GENE.GHUV01020695.1~~GHUV01020695.1.p1  ORF type:complete len:158 (-),score=21.11 GHUV01020695.1:66-539(-)